MTMLRAPLTAREVCEDALRHIGAFTVRHTGADPEEVDVAAHFLDLVLMHVAAKQRRLWQLRTAEWELEAETTEYVLTEALGDEAPPDGLMFPVSLRVRDASGNEHPVDLIRRDAWEAIEDKTETANRPDRAWLDRRTPNMTLHIHPQPLTDDLTAILTFQTFNPDPTALRIEHRTTGLRPQYGLWAGFELARNIGFGAVRRLRDDELNQIGERAGELWADLEAYDDQEHANEPRISEPWGL